MQHVSYTSAIDLWAMGIITYQLLTGHLPFGLGEDPAEDEPHTNHEGLPPIRGVKYAANAWIHNYDYRTPAKRNCIFAHRNTHSPTFW